MKNQPPFLHNPLHDFYQQNISAYHQLINSRGGMEHLRNDFMRQQQLNHNISLMNNNQFMPNRVFEIPTSNNSHVSVIAPPPLEKKKNSSESSKGIKKGKLKPKLEKLQTQPSLCPPKSQGLQNFPPNDANLEILMRYQRINEEHTNGMDGRLNNQNNMPSNFNGTSPVNCYFRNTENLINAPIHIQHRIKSRTDEIHNLLDFRFNHSIDFAQKFSFFDCLSLQDKIILMENVDRVLVLIDDVNSFYNHNNLAKIININMQAGNVLKFPSLRNPYASFDIFTFYNEFQPSPTEYCIIKGLIMCSFETKQLSATGQAIIQENKTQTLNVVYIYMCKSYGSQKGLERFQKVTNAVSEIFKYWEAIHELYESLKSRMGKSY
uniref:NR LBD domain-containing protein n=1 Tax=Rhabditophanes sp. KR3021 TaxID=114890 RepID=A0AC35THK4_9BILA